MAYQHLPNELLSNICSFVDTPGDILRFGLTCKKFGTFLQLSSNDPWKAFLKGRLGVEGFDVDARRTVHGLTTLSRNWACKAFLARLVRPSERTRNIDDGTISPWRASRGQTMGYQPHIDSYEQILDNKWTERRELLAWSAGTHIIMRTKETGSVAKNMCEGHAMTGNTDESSDEAEFDAFGNLVQWHTYKLPHSRDGRDDITALQLLKPHQTPTDTEGVAYGTASGRLHMIYTTSRLEKRNVQHYDTGGRSVGSLSISNAKQKPLMAASLGGDSLALFPVAQPDAQGSSAWHPIAEASPEFSEAQPGRGRIWTTKFLSHDKVAIGLGPSYEPIRVYTITPSGFADSRNFSADWKYWDGRVDHDIHPSNRTMSLPGRSTSVYPITPLPRGSSHGSAEGDVFLSGSYGGLIRLHDMRSSKSYESLYWDPTNESPIYSLALQGMERVVAGVSQHSMLKVFDLRVSGSHAYHRFRLPRPKPRTPVNDIVTSIDSVDLSGGPKPLSYGPTNTHTPNTVSDGWNLFCRDSHSARDWSGRESPVYSLSIPSDKSPTLYVGLEGAVIQFDFLSIYDKHPDPLYKRAVVREGGTEAIHVKKSWNPYNDVLNLAMYEQGTEEGLAMKLLQQNGVGSLPRTATPKERDLAANASIRDLDGRWKDPSTIFDRRNRGDSGRGTGRGRGRGQHRGASRGWGRGGR